MKRCSRRLGVLVVLLTCCLLVTAVLAVDYDWTGGGGDRLWTTVGNWTTESSPCLTCYPSYAADNASIRDAAAEVELVNEQNNDLVLENPGCGAFAMILTGGGSQKVLTCSTVRIVGSPCEGLSTVVILAGSAILETQ